MFKTILINAVLVFNSFSFSLYAQEQHIDWQKVAPGIWKGIVGLPEKVTPLAIADAKPLLVGLEKLGDRQFPEIINESLAGVVDNKVYFRFPLQKEEQLFGLGLNFKSLQQRGRIKTLHVDHYDGRDNGRTHAPVPFYVSDLGYGILLNTARYVEVYAGTGVRKDSEHAAVEKNRNLDKDWNAQPYSDAVEILIPSTGVEVYLFAGKNTMEVMQRFNLYQGGGTLPPKWGLGFTYRTPTLFSDKDVLADVKEFEERGFPLSFVGLEPGWQSRSYPNTFVWDSLRFPNPKGFIAALSKEKVKVNLWINPYISSYSPIFKQIQPYTSSHTVWVGQVPDFTLQPARDIYKQLFKKQHLDIGVSGYKVDEVDGFDSWLWPDVARFPSGISGEQMRQIYGIQFQKMTDLWFREMNQRTYGLVRSSHAGASSMPYVIYNDYYNHHDFITALCSSSFTGVLWTPEARSSKTAEEWLRRMQSVCFSPMAMLNAWADGTKPWTFPEVTPQVRDVMLLRMQLLPYLYTSFAQYHFEGKPPIRAMNLVEDFYYKTSEVKGVLSSTENPYATSLREDVKDQFMLGDFLLVAPMFEGQQKRKLILPKGKWYDFYTGRYVGAEEVIEITPGLDKIPLFVKEGGIIPMIPPVLKTPDRMEQLPLTIRVYGKAANTFNLYDDDGETFDYEKGAYQWINLEVKTDKKGNLKGYLNPVKGRPFHYKDVKWEFMGM